MRHENPAGSIEIPRETVEGLFQWHGGQGTGLYSLASSAHAGRPVTVEMVERAENELQQSLNIERSRYQERRGSRRERAEILERIEQLEELIASLQEAVVEGAGERLANPVISSHGSITRADYPSVFGDSNMDGIPDVDDPNPHGASVGDTIEEVQLSQEIGKLIDVRADYKQAASEVASKLESLGGSGAKVKWRVKTPYSIVNKLRRKRLGTLTDVAATMVVLPDAASVRRVTREILLGALGKVREHEDFYAKPNNGYRAQHFIVEHDGRPVEVQVKTKRMSQISAAAHEAYKNGHLDGARMDQLTSLADRADQGDPEAVRAYEREVASRTPEELGAMLSRGGRLSNPVEVVRDAWTPDDELWGSDGARRSNPHGGLAPAEIEDVSEDEFRAEMLVTAADSDGTLYPLKKQIMATLAKRRERGDYDHERAASAFSLYIIEAAKLLAKENQASGEDARSWVLQYPSRVRRLAADLVASNVEAEWGVGEREASLNADIYEERSPAEGGRLANPLYPALGPASDMSEKGGRKSNPVERSVPLKLLQPEIGGAGARLSNPSHADLLEEMAREEAREKRLSLPEARARVRAAYQAMLAKQGAQQPRAANPLKSGCSKDTIRENIRRELHKHPEMPVDQGVAIAYAHARQQGCKVGKKRKANPADMAVAEEIARQLGGTGRLRAMIGAENFVGDTNLLQFRWKAKARNAANSIRIVLDPSDTYTVTFYSVRGTSVKEKGSYSGIYADDLRGLFERETGLRIAL